MKEITSTKEIAELCNEIIRKAECREVQMKEEVAELRKEIEELKKENEELRDQRVRSLIRPPYSNGTIGSVVAYFFVPSL